MQAYLSKKYERTKYFMEDLYGWIITYYRQKWSTVIVFLSMCFQIKYKNILVFKKKVLPLQPQIRNNIAEWSSW